MVKKARRVPSFADAEDNNNDSNSGFVSADVRQRLVHTVSPHVDSFDYFLEYGIQDAISDIPPMFIEFADLQSSTGELERSTIARLNYESVNISYPSRKNDVVDYKLTPREARESGVSYSASMHATLAVEIFEYRHQKSSADDSISISSSSSSKNSGVTTLSEKTPSKSIASTTIHSNEGATSGSGIRYALKNRKEILNVSVRCGDLPIMVLSDNCHLKGLPASQLVALKEEASEVGGYFIMNGIERVIRLLQVPRRNYALAIERSSYKNRGSSYSEKGVSMRCVRSDQTSATVTLHYLNNGGATLRFVIRKQEFLLPVILVAKALVNISDKELFDRIVRDDTNNTFLTTRLEVLLRDFKAYNIFTKTQCQRYLGSLFRPYLPITDHHSDEEAGAMLIRRFLFIHTDSFADKVECLLHMIRKLFSFAQGTCVADNADAVMNHELLLPGHLINMYVKEKLQDALLGVRMQAIRELRMNKNKCLLDCVTSKFYQRLMDRQCASIGGKIGTFISTGNLVSSSGLDLMQVSGYTVVAERLNMLRYMSHFQSVHRGQFFTTMKTTTVRKLLPESWGFLCPVHTPDGSPCGLLNHLARDAVIVSYPVTKRPPTTTAGRLVPSYHSDKQQRDAWNAEKVNSRHHIQQLLASLGMVAAGVNMGDGQISLDRSHVPVLLDGVVLGGIPENILSSVVSQLRLIKSLCNMQASGSQKGIDMGPNFNPKKWCIDPTMELACIPIAKFGGGAYPGLYMFTQPGRLIRQVHQLHSHRIEWIGPMEQVYMEIACLLDDVREDTTHIEVEPTAMLSHIAAMTPYSDYNQSPRNMYQCQMGKQTMGTPVHAWKHRSDNKLYRIQNPQAALVQTKVHREYLMDEYPQGTNAVVAVISYTGYDMEDAMIINKASYERGFGHGYMYKTAFIDLDEEEKHLNSLGVKPQLRFSNIVVDKSNATNTGKRAPSPKKDPASGVRKYCESLDDDGLPPPGLAVEYHEPICCLVDTLTGEQRFIGHKEHERAVVDTVRIIGMGQAKSSTSSAAASAAKRAPLRRVCITLRYRRNPVIGDKFSSRHGQKGTLSVLWPQENMPFSEYGMSPDVLINPHAFPSRMTIGMLVESMAGKSGSMNGLFQDATPFQFHEDRKVIDYLGEQLRAVGYQYYGSEPLYNGLTGNLMQADIFMGVVFYQRLRHMVSDKSQVRSTGPVTAITRQPVKGRKKHGGIRLGEMERDALLSHGVAFCLQDRLMGCSDAHLAYVCSSCGSLLSVYSQPAGEAKKADDPDNYGKGICGQSGFEERVQTCTICKSSSSVCAVNLPYVFRYLANELAGMGIKISLSLSE